MALTPSIRSLVLGMLLLGLCGMRAQGSAAEDVYCLDGTIISNVISVKARIDTLSVTTAAGVVGVPFTNLPTAVRIKYGYDAFEAGYVHAHRARPVINRLSDCFSMAHLDQAKAKAQRDGKCLGFILVWGQYFGSQVFPQGQGGDCATAQFVACFKDSLVLVFVRHETEIGHVPAAVHDGYSGPDEGGFAPSMAVTDPACSTYICEVPMGGSDSDGAKRLTVFRNRIDRIKAWLTAHPEATAAAQPLTAPNGPTQASGEAASTAPGQGAAAADTTVVSNAVPVPVAPPETAPAVAAAKPAAPSAHVPAAPNPAASITAASSATDSATSASPGTAAANDSAATAAATAPASPTPAVPPAAITYQEVTLTDGRVLLGHLAVDHSAITLISLTSGKAISDLPLSPAAISTVVEKQFTPAADSAGTLTPAQRALKSAERAVVYDIYQLNSAKQLSADTIQEDMTWDRTTAHIVPTSQSQSDMLHERLDNLHHRLASTAAAIPIAKAQVDKALATYKGLGGTRDFAPLFKEPPTPH